MRLHEDTFKEQVMEVVCLLICMSIFSTIISAIGMTTIIFLGGLLQGTFAGLFSPAHFEYIVTGSIFLTVIMVIMFIFDLR